MSQHDIDKVVKRSSRLLTYLQIAGIAGLLVLFVMVVILGTLLFQNRHRIAEQIAANTDNRIRISGIITRQTAEQARIRSALCDNQFTIATVSVPANSTKVLVQFVESSRKAFIILQCPGHIGVPPKDLQKAGQKQHIPIRY